MKKQFLSIILSTSLLVVLFASSSSSSSYNIPQNAYAEETNTNWEGIPISYYGFIKRIAYCLNMMLSTHEAYGLMTKEKLAELVKEKNEQEGIITIPQEQQSEPLTSHEKIEKLLKENEEREKINEELENDGIKYQTYEDAYLEITNEHYGTNYTSLEEASLGLYERYLDEMSIYEWRLR